MIKDSIDDIELSYLNKLFNYIRIVDPVKKIVIKEYSEKMNLEKTNFQGCSNGTICENCISIRAYNENTSVIKFEYINNKIYMIMATPLDKEKSRYVIETIKDITDSKIIDNIYESQRVNLKYNIDKMNKLIITDELTECYNRRYINERLPVEIDSAQSNNECLSIAMIDIDYFKVINDRYGHLVGDMVLKDIIKIIKNNIRVKNDWIARYGGEEFLVVFNNTDSEEAYNLLQRLKLIIENNIIKYKDIEIKITISIGIATLNNEINDKDKIIEKADYNLYKAKRSGRNIIVR